MFSSSELDHLLKNIFKVFEIYSFLDWVIGALARRIEDCPDRTEDFAFDWLGVLSCSDRPISDSSLELASLFSMGMFTSKGVSPTEESALLFTPLDRSRLFPQITVKEILSDLQSKPTTRRPRKPVPSTSRSFSPLQPQSFRGGKAKTQSRPRSNLRPPTKSIKRSSFKTNPKK